MAREPPRAVLSLTPWRAGTLPGRVACCMRRRSEAALQEALKQEQAAPKSSDAAAGEEGEGSSSSSPLSVLNALGIIVGGGLGGYVFLLQKGKEVRACGRAARPGTERQRLLVEAHCGMCAVFSSCSFKLTCAMGEYVSLWPTVQRPRLWPARYHDCLRHVRTWTQAQPAFARDAGSSQGHATHRC